MADTPTVGKVQPSVAFEEFAGRAGGVTVVRGRTGMVTQSPPKYRRHISPLQAQAMARTERAGLAWESLDEASVAAWRRYAEGIVRHGDLGGKAYHPLAFNLFSGLFCKLLQIDPSAPVPLWPPFEPFLGDSISVTASAATHAILFAASGPNQLGVLTELLFQKLPGRHRLPKPAYKSAGFAAFAESDLAFELPVEAGYYACASNFVEASTGRTMQVTPLGTVAVGV